MLLNIQQWEFTNSLTSDENEIIELLDIVEHKSLQQKNKKFEYPIKSRKCDLEFEGLKEIQVKYSRKQEQLDTVSKNLQLICNQLRSLGQDKEKIIENISNFHSEASQHITIQKGLIDYSYQIQENLQYYQNISKLVKDMESGDQQDLSFQVVISEINDGIVFFQSRPNFHNSERSIQAYYQLKKKVLAICKTAIFKLLNREAQFINQKISVLKDVLCVFYPSLQAKQDPNPFKLQFLAFIFPQFMSIFQSIPQNRSSFNQYSEDYQKFFINQSMHDFFAYLEVQLTRDQELFALYNDVFSQFLSYNRYNLHQQLNDIISRQAQNVVQTGSILTKISSSIQKNVQSFIYPEVLIFETLFNIIFEICIIESLYCLFFFQSTVKVVQESHKTMLGKIITLYYTTLKSFMAKHSNLDHLVAMSEHLIQNKFILKDFLDASSIEQFQNFGYLYILLQKIILQKKKSNKTLEFLNKELLINSQQLIGLFVNNFLDKIQLDIMHRAIQTSQLLMQQKIYHFQPKEYIRNMERLIIHKILIKHQPTFKGYKLQRDEIYPSVIHGLEIITKMQKSVDQTIFKQLAGEVLREINSQLKQVAEQYEVKFDSYLFYLKNIILLCNHLQNLGGNYIVRESELDFSETKALLLQLISGQLRPEIQWVELTSPEKLWTYITNFFQFMYKGMPKLNQYEVDWKNNLMNQKNVILFQFVKDMTFIVAKPMIEFLRKYQYLQHKLDEEKSEFPRKDFEQLISIDSLRRAYQLFFENIIDFMQEIVLKLNNFLQREIFIEIEQYIAEIISNSLQLLSQFYIIASKHLTNEEYEKCNFMKVDEIRNQIIIQYFD